MPHTDTDRCLHESDSDHVAIKQSSISSSSVVVSTKSGRTACNVDRPRSGIDIG